MVTDGTTTLNCRLQPQVEILWAVSVTNRYVIRRDENGSFSVEIEFHDGGTATIRGFSTEEEAERWVYERWEEQAPDRR